jgi:type IV secretory pathway VirB10-like protein
MTPEVGRQLVDRINQNIPFEDYKKFVEKLAIDTKITPEIAKLKIEDYRLVKGLRQMSQKLASLQANNAAPATYANELKNAVQAGLIKPEEAAEFMQNYQAMTAKGNIVGGSGYSSSSADYNQLQQQIQEGASQQGMVTADQFNVAQTETTTQSDQERLARINAMSQAMSTQAQQLVSSWQVTPMAHKAGVEAVPAAGKPGEAGGGGGTLTQAQKDAAALKTQGAPLVKAGTILFAVLDTAVNSDYPDSPVMATIVDGKYKGAKLLGKLITTKSVSGQMDRVTLNFTMMNLEAWPKSKSVTAYAIDPDTDRTVFASSADYHYMQKFGAIMATSFVQGYANAINTSASTSTTGIFGTSTTHPELSPSQKLATAVGQIGQSLASVTQNYTNIPPTVTVDAGVGLGILFMSDVTDTA